MCGQGNSCRGEGSPEKSPELTLKTLFLTPLQAGLNSTKLKYSLNYISSKFTALNKTAPAVCWGIFACHGWSIPPGTITWRKGILLSFQFPLLTMRAAWPQHGLCLHLWIPEACSDGLAQRRELPWSLGQLIPEGLACEHLHLQGEDKQRPTLQSVVSSSLLSPMKSHFLSTHAKCKNRNKDTHLNKQKTESRRGGRPWCTPTSTERCFLFAVLCVRPCHVTWTRMWVGDLLDTLALQMSHNCRNTCFTLFFLLVHNKIPPWSTVFNRPPFLLLCGWLKSLVSKSWATMRSHRNLLQ